MPQETPEGNDFYGYSPGEGRKATEKQPDAIDLKSGARVPAESVTERDETELAVEAQRPPEVTPESWQEHKAQGFEALYGFELGTKREKALQGATIRRLERKLGADNVLVGTEYDDQRHRPRPTSDSDRSRSVYVRVPTEMAA